MPDFKTFVLNKCEEDNTLTSKLAKLLGYAQPSGLKKFLTYKEREFKNFNKLLSLVKLTFKEDEQLKMLDMYIETLDPKNKLARESLEYAYINKRMGLFEKLLKSLSECKNEESREWAEIYQLDYDIAEGKISKYEAIRNLDKFKSSKSEKTDVFRFISKMYAYYDLGAINAMNEFLTFIDEIKSKLEENDYVSDSYLGRIALTMMESRLYNNEVEETRRIAYEVMDRINSPSIECMINVTLGNSYVFESFDESFKYLHKAYEIAFKYKNENGMIQSSRSLNFLHNYWGKDCNYVIDQDAISDKHENAFYLIRQGKIENALEVLNGMDITELNDRQLGFHNFYRGLIQKDLKTFRKSVKYFHRAGEKFFIKASLIELQKLGEDEDVLEIYSI